MLASITIGQPAAAAPNIVFILADDLGFGDTGVTGQNARAAQGSPSFATPNIDSIAQAGAKRPWLIESEDVSQPLAGDVSISGAPIVRSWSRGAPHAGQKRASDVVAALHRAQVTTGDSLTLP